MTFHQENINFVNSLAHITLAGTLTMPDRQGTFPAVVLISGYGAHDRDMTSGNHKYFKILAEHLTQSSIAVLRYDKRGVGESSGDWKNSTSLDLAGDVLAAIDYLKTRKEIDANHIGVIGLSEGGLIATMVAAKSTNISFVVLMAPYIARGIDLLIKQAGLQLAADGASAVFVAGDHVVRTMIYQIAQQEENSAHAAERIKKAIVEYAANVPQEQAAEMLNLPWALTAEKADMMAATLTSIPYRFILNYDPMPVVEAIKIPTLAVVGSRDLVTPAENIFSVLKAAFAKSGHTNYNLIELPHLNHCFQTAVTGALSEYATLKETMAPIALHTMSDWIKKITE